MTRNVLSYALAWASLCCAGPITYNVNQTVGAGSVTGTITTDGNSGTLGSGDITGFNITVSNGSSMIQLTSPTDAATVFGSGLSATSTGLFLDYTQNSGLLIEGVNTPTTGNNTFVCWEGGTLNCTNGPTGIDICVDCSNGSNAGAVILDQSGVQEIASTTLTPEPSSLLLVGLGAGVLGYGRRKSITQRTSGGRRILKDHPCC